MQIKCLLKVLKDDVGVLPVETKLAPWSKTAAKEPEEVLSELKRTSQAKQSSATFTNHQQLTEVCPQRKSAWCFSLSPASLSATIQQQPTFHG